MTHTQKICDCNSTWFHALDSTGLNRVEKLVSLARWQVSQDFKLHDVYNINHIFPEKSRGNLLQSFVHPQMLTYLSCSSLIVKQYLYIINRTLHTFKYIYSIQFLMDLAMLRRHTLYITTMLTFSRCMTVNACDDAMTLFLLS